MKRILVLTFSDVARDPRVRRQCSLVAKHGRVVLASPGSNPFENIDHVVLGEGCKRSLTDRLLTAFRLGVGAFDACYWSQTLVRDALARLGGDHFDLVVANDLECLPLALTLAQQSPVILDAHEYAPAEFDDQLFWRILIAPYRRYLCARYMRMCAGVTTVSEGIAEEYRNHYCDAVSVFPNACDWIDLDPVVPEPGRIKLVHHGLALPSRCLERMVDMFAYLDDRFTLTFMLLPGPQGYLEKLKRRAADYHRIRFAEPVPVTEICRATNRFDVGIFLLPPMNFNYAHALPNKFFEFVQARLAVAIGPSPEMMRYVHDHGLGVVSDDFDARSFATVLNHMTEDDCWRYKQNAHAAAQSLAFFTYAQRFEVLVASNLEAK